MRGGGVCGGGGGDLHGDGGGMVDGGAVGGGHGGAIAGGGEVAGANCGVYFQAAEGGVDFCSAVHRSAGLHWLWWLRGGGGC